jgi:hypothetical protein
MSGAKVTVRPPDLPATTEGFLACRRTTAGRTFNDRVEDTILSLVNGGNESFVSLLNAVNKEDTVEGSITADDFMAAKMIRDHAARDDGDPIVASAKLHTILRGQKVALCRYNFGRNQRRAAAVASLTESE